MISLEDNHFLYHEKKLCNATKKIDLKETLYNYPFAVHTMVLRVQYFTNQIKFTQPEIHFTQLRIHLMQLGIHFTQLRITFLNFLFLVSLSCEVLDSQNHRKFTN